MAAENPVPTVADFCGLSGTEATQLLADTLANLANGTALEDCAVQARSVSLERGSVAGTTTPTTDTMSVIQTINLPTVTYDSCVDLSITLRFGFDLDVEPNQEIIVNLHEGATCAGTLLLETRQEKSQPVGQNQQTAGFKSDAQVCFPAGTPRQVTVCAERTTGSGIASIELENISWTGSCGS